jgi:hypothetical protein
LAFLSDCSARSKGVKKVPIDRYLNEDEPLGYLFFKMHRSKKVIFKQNCNSVGRNKLSFYLLKWHPEEKTLLQYADTAIGTLLKIRF